MNQRKSFLQEKHACDFLQWPNSNSNLNNLPAVQSINGHSMVGVADAYGVVSGFSSLSPKLLAMLLASMLATVLLSGCGDPNGARLIGEWGIDTPNSVLQRLGEESEAASSTETIDQAETQEASHKMRIQFRGNGTMTTITTMGRVTPVPKQGRWSLQSWDEANQILKIECSLSGQSTEHEIEILDDDTIRLVPPNMAGLNLKLKFKRIKQQ